jgi:signal transduction histidine kinase
MRTPIPPLNWRDLAQAAGLIGLVFLGAVIAPPGRVGLDVGGYALLVVAAAATAARRAVPVAVLAVTTAAMVAYEIRGYPGVVPALPVLVALFTAVRAGHRWPAGAAVGVIAIGGLIGELTCDQLSPDVLQRWYLLIGWLLAAAVTGALARAHRAYLEQVEQRAADAERTREETAQRRADAERVRIARELHDTLTHHISIIKVHAGVAVHLARKRDEPVPDALVAIERASGDAMRELRATLELLRGDQQPPGGLDGIADLLDGVRAAGLPVQMTVDGERRRLPTVVDRTAYRIVQEALTNTTRHAGAAAASVRFAYGDDVLSVRVDDDGRGCAEVVPGIGLSGMRERVIALGGSLRTGPRPGGGFSVRAELPLVAPTNGAT